MTSAEALVVLNAYGIANPQNFQNQFGPRANATGEYAVLHQPAFQPAVNGDINKFRVLLTYLDKEVAVRGPVLLAVNAVFGLSLNALLDNSALLTSNSVRPQLLAIAALGAASRLVIATFYGRLRLKKPQPAPADLVRDIVTIFVGLAEAEVVAVLNAVNNSNGDPTLVRTTNMTELIRLRQACPGERFQAGFTRWGPGDGGGDEALNHKNHFHKHVCDQTHNFTDEAVYWWGALNVQVRSNELANPAPSNAELACFKQDGSLDRRHVKDFIQAAVWTRADLRDLLFQRYGDAYSNYAFQLSRDLRNIMVESNGVLSGISGFSGHVFLFGRFDATGHLGLSSCYFVVQANRADKLNPDKPAKVWSLTK